MKNIFLVFALTISWNLLAAQKDPVIEKMVNEVSKDSLEAYVRKMVSFGTRNTLSTQTDPNRGIGAARNWVLSRFNEFAKQSGGRLTAIIDTTTFQKDGARSIDTILLLGNVMATLKGVDPNDKRIFIISGHLDSRRTNLMDRVGDAPGANDDASGVAAVMECARIMSKHPFPATIIFVAVSGEEQALLGSMFMANKAKKENWNIEAVLNNDIVGGNNENETNKASNDQVRVFSEGFSVLDTVRVATFRRLGLENDGKARQLARYTKEIGERYIKKLKIVMVYRNDRFLRSGDHTPYVLRGFAAVRMTEMNENYNHQHQDVRMENGVQFGDLPEYMDFEYLRKNTGMNLCVLANLAKSPSMPQEVKVENTGLTNFTNLTWKAPASGKVKGYNVLMRETTNPVWEKKMFTTDTKMNLSYSKDNYFFAVQSVSEDGNESLPEIPTPVNR